jgi:hypothetical protein
MSTQRNTITGIALILLTAFSACSEDAAGPTTPAGDTGRTPPARIVDPQMTWPSGGGGATLTWTAPADNSGGTVGRYEIRYSHSEPMDWNLSRLVDDPPEPAAPGETQLYEFTNPDAGRNLYAAIRSFDDAGNASPVSPVAGAYVSGYTVTGTCYEPLTGERVAGLAVSVTANRVVTATTDANGKYILEELAGGKAHVSVRSGDSGMKIHDYDLTVDLAGSTGLEHPVVLYTPAENPLGQNVLKLCVQAALATSRDGRLKKWAAYPVDVYVPPFVNSNGIDYEDYAKRAALRWNERTGLNIFTVVDTPPANGIELVFLPREQIAPHNGLADIEPDDNGFPIGATIRIIDELGEEKLWSIALHELGHTIHIGHLPRGYLMFAGQPLPDDITDDEVKMIRLFMALPNNLDLDVYDVSAPAF